MQSIFITGGAGFVGSHVLEAVLQHAPDVRVIVLMRTRHPESYFVRRELDKRVVCVSGDLRDAKVVRDCVFNYQVDTIFHLAAQPLVTVALANPHETWETNVMGSVNVLEAARTSPWVKAVVVASSDKAYGQAQFQPYTENHPLHGLHPYDTSKSCTDLIAQAYAKCYGTPVVVSRFGNIYGPGDHNANRLIPGAMLALARGTPLEIRSNGQLRRDFVYVKDVAHAYIKLADVAARYKGEAFNCTSGVNRTVLEMIADIGRILGRQIPHWVANSAAYEIPEQALSNEKIRQLVGVSPQYSLEQAIRETWDWYQAVCR